MRRRRRPLDDRITALAQAADLAEGRVDPALVGRAREVVARAGARRGLSLRHTVAAVAGATGSGKSSLVNALAGAELVEVGVTRPTTAKAQAVVWGPEGSGPLLDWLDVPLRHTVGASVADAEEQSGLILLDLPDHDSIMLSHRLEVDRLVAVVDLLIWVLDPQKYADAAVHERYLRPLARHRDVVIVVLNQIDRLPGPAVSRCLAHLRRLLAADGLTDVPVLGVSARTGEGMAELQALLNERVTRRTAWAARLAADAATAALALRGHAPPAGAASGAAGVPRARVGALVRALEQAAAVPVVVNAVAKAHRHRSATATGWPVTRWLRRLRPDPLRRLGLTRSPAGRTSLPPATSVQVAAVDAAVRELGAAAADGVPEPWATAVRHAARSREGELADALDRMVVVSAETRAPRWWRAAGALQWLLAGAMLLGALWLLGLFVLDWLRLPPPPTPTAGELPWPTVLLLGGAVLGVLVALLCRLASWFGGWRRARKAARALRAGVERIAGELVVEPIEAELRRYRRFLEQVEVAAAR